MRGSTSVGALLLGEEFRARADEQDWGLTLTSRASATGFLMRSTPATAPTSSVSPSITPASICARPSLVRTLPVPALKPGLSSSAMIAASMASIADPPRKRTSQPACAAA